MIELKKVHKSFGDLEVLKGIDLTVNKGEVLSVIGGSGSGKSTMLYCINAIERIQKGEVIVDGISVHDKSTNINTLRQKIGMVFQQWNSFPHLTVLENAALSPQIVLGKTKEQAEKIAITYGQESGEFIQILSGALEHDTFILSDMSRWNKSTHITITQ